MTEKIQATNSKSNFSEDFKKFHDTHTWAGPNGKSNMATDLTATGISGFYTLLAKGADAVTAGKILKIGTTVTVVVGAADRKSVV